MFLFRSLTALAWLALAILHPGANAQDRASVVTTERVRAQLLAHAPVGVTPGQTVWLGLQIRHQREWHTYWKNPGDSGLPTSLTWTLPAGVSAGEVAWPTPKKIPIGHLANYGYEGAVLLTVPLRVAADFKPPLMASQLEVKLRASWLVCRQECIPEEGEFTLKLPVRGSTALHAADFEAARQALPVALANGSTARIEGQQLLVSVTGLPASVRGQNLEFFPETAAITEPAGAWTQRWEGAVWRAALPLSAQRSEAPETLAVVVAAGPQGWRSQVTITGPWPAVTPPAPMSAALEQALQRNASGSSAVSLSLGAALLGALLGGLILNLMPCVFPVLAVKMVGFARHHGNRRARHAGGLAYGAGVVLSFVALGALMLGLRAGGEQLGWGFQLQSPAVVAALAGLFTLLGLNLAGMFEFGSVLPSRVATLEARHPLVNDFLSGVLAVAIASPCTVPFMGASLGLAVSLPAPQALAVFAALGVGMALPYLLASFVPAVARAMPRPGAWMVTFRQLMAFPMGVTVVWLLWVLGQQSGIDGAAALLTLLLALGLVVWAWTQRGRARRVLGTVAAGLLVGGIAVLGPYIVRDTPTVSAGVPASARWQPWSAQVEQQLVAAGRPVFVDYTAAWCVTCQYNKATALSDAGLLADFSARQVALLRADWTRRDPAITAALAALGRSGVPVYVLHAPGRPPQVLSEVLSVTEVRALLAGL